MPWLEKVRLTFEFNMSDYIEVLADDRDPDIVV